MAKTKKTKKTKKPTKRTVPAKAKAKAKAKPRPKTTTETKTTTTTEVASKAAKPGSGGATMFDGLTWGTPLETIAASIGVRPSKGTSSLSARRTIEGVPFQVTYQFEDGGLRRISLSGLRRYDEHGMGDDDQIAALDWVAAQAGPFTERDAGKAKWLLPTVKIWSYCDESLGIYYEPPPPK